MFQLAKSHLTLNGAVSNLSFPKQSCQKTNPVVVEKMVLCFGHTHHKNKILVKNLCNFGWK